MSSGDQQAAVSHQTVLTEHCHLRGTCQDSRIHGDRTHQWTEGWEFGVAADIAHQPSDGRQGDGDDCYGSCLQQQQESRGAVRDSGTSQDKHSGGGTRF